MQGQHACCRGLLSSQACCSSCSCSCPPWLGSAGHVPSYSIPFFTCHSSRECQSKVESLAAVDDCCSCLLAGLNGPCNHLSFSASESLRLSGGSVLSCSRVSWTQMHACIAICQALHPGAVQDATTLLSENTLLQGVSLVLKLLLPNTLHSWLAG